ncbi:flagellar motor protein MotB [Aquimarina sp. W85]|uniref:OmpA/MotB family protein n=1 Tax=Aquimarina rhodophyticola TaxID=3342246 RepID=UPI0036705E56
MNKILTLVLLGSVLTTSCVSKKKFLAVEEDLQNTKNTLQKTTVEKEELEAKYAKIEARVEDYNSKIDSLTENGNKKMEMADNVTVISNDAKKGMRKILENVDSQKLSEAKTLKDSMNLAVSHTLKNSLDESAKNNDDITVNIENTVVMISISDKMIFKTGSYRVSKDADALLSNLATIINSKPNLEVMIEGHTDSRNIRTNTIEDNWDLSVKRATSITRLLQNKYKIDPSKLIASGRSSYKPVAENDTKENMAKNRRTRIILLPKLDEFFSLVSAN